MPLAPDRTVIVIAGGDAPARADLLGVPEGASVICADSGVDHALALGLRVDVAVGDFDSVSEGGLAAVQGAGAEIRRFPAEKDATDLELALDAALEYRPERVVVLGAQGGRFDHELANLLLIAAPRYAQLRPQARHAGGTVTVIHDSARLYGSMGDQVSLLPVHGAAMGVVTAGLKYPLTDETLGPGSSRGVSNEFQAEQALIGLSSGTLWAIQSAGETGAD
ncbi:MAG: thiamine diphosphokinase [Mycobacteriales bacterium]